MQKTDLDKAQATADEAVPGEFGLILREIEKEVVPERLLELALKLQAALVDQRKGGSGGPESDGAG